MKTIEISLNVIGLTVSVAALIWGTAMLIKHRNNGKN